MMYAIAVFMLKVIYKWGNTDANSSPIDRLVGNPQFNLFQLPPDRSVDDLLASLEGSQSKGTNSGSTRKEKDGLKSAEKGIIANISDDGSDTDDDGNVSLKFFIKLSDLYYCGCYGSNQ